MKPPIALLALPLLAAAPALPAEPAPPIADLVIVHVDSPNLDGGILRVWVRNQGTANAAPAMMRVYLYGLQSLDHNFPQPAVAAGQTVLVTIYTGKPYLIQVNYSVRADQLNTVPESNEMNNYIIGKFGGKL